MPFDPHLLKQFDLIRGIPSFEAALTNPEFGALFERFQQDPEPWVFPSGVEIENVMAPGPHGPIPVRIYRARESAQSSPALLWMHGGAFVFGDLNMNEAHMVAAELAARARAVVVSVDYRLAVGGVKYPVPLDDVVAAWEWMVTSVDRLALDPRRLFIGGASAGGNLAAAAAARVRDAGGQQPAAMVLAYPPVHFPMPALEPETIHEMRIMPQVLHFTVDYHEWKTRNYLGRITNVPAGVAPGNFELEGMPAAYIAPAEFDELRPSAELFARQLESVGVFVSTQLAEGMVHGFLNRTPSLPAIERTLQFFANAIEAHRVD